MDHHEVTNQQFSEFVDQTGYITTAQQVGKAQVFDADKRRWSTVAGADWQHPEGPNSSLIGRQMQPAVQVSWHDARAYAAWAKKRLPTEAEWERAARGGLYDTDFPWGREETPGGRYQANYWQGWFPDTDRGVDGFVQLAPVGSFPPNRLGLHDMAGNVWEWCADWYGDTAYQASPTAQPRGPADGTERVLRGGSWLCAENYSPGIRVSTRHHAPPTQCSNHIGFRCAGDSAPR
jgi:formylglycine-generating enzyme required for sulfatase activity